MQKTLLDISQDLLRLNELLDECDDYAANNFEDASKFAAIEQRTLIRQWLDDIGAERDKKLDAYAALISQLQYQAEARRKEATRMAQLAQTDENKLKLLKERLKEFFIEQSLNCVNTTRYRISIAKNGGKVPLIVDKIDYKKVPQSFQKISVELDTTAIREALEAGEELDFARLGERGQSIRIK